MKTNILGPEFSRPLIADKIPATGTESALTADPKELLLLAKRFSLLELKKFEALLKIKPVDAGQVIKITGTWVADVVQQCGVSLEPLASHLKQDVDVSYLSLDAATEFVSSTEAESFEKIEDGVIDLGELVSQLMGAALDPYPRKAGLAFVEVEVGEPTSHEGPLAKLVQFKKKTKDS